LGSFEKLEYTGHQDRVREFARIVGSSRALESALALVQRVAPAPSAVLVLGETGTGKELIARAIHNLSPRYDRPFITLNCAAIPHDLLESELFGHEKGAFTGAISQKIGRFEMADKGTLFLDEVGDIPPGLQPKLLRVLQEQKFERLGSGRTHQVDVRLVTATNRDLTKMVAQGEFRSDLYYRLNVFPILLPPLRARCEDVPALVEYFVEIFCRRLGKEIERIPLETMAAFQSYSWPGNVRELQNLVERAVILADDGVLANPLAASVPQAVSSAAGPTKLKDLERAFIVQTLEEAGWVVGGPDGAAAKLGLKRTTLLHRMKMLQIEKPTRSAVRLKLPLMNPNDQPTFGQMAEFQASSS
jgi:transcriptional regulator with GAF, ATPase, and Fis domain